ncbi:hypothetical protein GF325_07130, partial [Candidatus Bathyarchaeota archaeon]|nr:hypothetical protein [Candidatus Bathyarchaeota archaeon]
MAINWEKVEKKPEKFHKVAGQILLDYRAREKSMNSVIEELKKKLEDKTDTGSTLKADLEASKVKIETLEEKITNLKSKVSSKEDAN